MTLKFVAEYIFPKINQHLKILDEKSYNFIIDDFNPTWKVQKNWI